MTRSESGRLGAIASSEKNRIRILKIVERYEANPKLCKNCGKKLPYVSRRNDFCSKTCSGKFHANDLRHHKLAKKECEFCHSEFQPKHLRNRFCSQRCSRLYSNEIRYRHAEKVGQFESSSSKTNLGEASRHFVRGYLASRFGYRCSICGIETWNGKPISLVVDHKDGNPYNNNIENFRLVCPNCDSQLPTFKGRNRGNGRTRRRV